MKLRLWSTAAALVATTAASAIAAPYASGIRTSGGNVSFVLNEPADNVSVTGVGGAPLNLGALSAGRHSFPLGSFTSWEIKVGRNAPSGFTAVSQANNQWAKFERPGGLAINQNPASPFFGTVYVNVNRDLAADGVTPISTAGANPRPMGNGIYSLTADLVGVDLPTFTVPPDPNATSLAKTAGLNVSRTSSSSWYRIGMDDAGNIIAGDWTDPLGGLKVLSADLTTGAVLLRGEGGPTGGLLSDDQDEFGFLPLHGSAAGEPQARGVWGTNLSVAVMDEDLDVDLAINTANDGNSVWRWNIGSTTSNFAGAPTLEVGVGSLTANAADPMAPASTVGQHSDGSSVFLSLNIGVTANAQYNPFFNKWYLSGSRTNGNDSSSLVIVTPESGPGADGKDIVVDWASKQFSIDNGLDGYVDTTEPIEPLSTDPASDIFRNVHNVTFSPDNKTMFVHRRVVSGENPVLGNRSNTLPGPNLGAKILAVPLDANGLPIITINDNGTPLDKADDYITNLVPIGTSSNPGSQGSFSQVKTDAAGNLYFTENVSERLEFFSRGGNTLATTTSAGTFSIVDVVASFNTGDFNGDGRVDGGDLSLLLANWGSTVPPNPTGWTGAAPTAAGIDADELSRLLANWGFGTSTAVPEPSAAVLAVLAGVGMVRRRR
jgi:hypothetical protein